MTSRTWCECGCGEECDDELVQYLLEEACMTALDAHEASLALPEDDSDTAASEAAIARSQGRLAALRGGS